MKNLRQNGNPKDAIELRLTLEALQISLDLMQATLNHLPDRLDEVFGRLAGVLGEASESTVNTITGATAPFTETAEHFRGMTQSFSDSLDRLVDFFEANNARFEAIDYAIGEIRQNQHTLEESQARIEAMLNRIEERLGR